MSIQSSYNEWSSTYAQDRNLTRDLSASVLREMFRSARFKSIIEIGCGTGKNTPFLTQIGGNVHAMDFSEEMIGIAKNEVKENNVSFSLADITGSWPCKSGSVDLIVCNLVLEHVEKLSHIFSEANRSLDEGGIFSICELHPFRQYLGGKATFQHQGKAVEIPAFVHHISDFLSAANEAAFELKKLQEWWHEEDFDKPPRVVSFLFEKRGREEL